MTDTKRMAPAQLPVDLHKWLKREAFERETTITAELTEAVMLLRAQRATGDALDAQHAARVQQ